MRRHYCRKCGNEILPEQAMFDSMHEQCYDQIEGQIEERLIAEHGMIGAIIDTRGGQDGRS